jgi:hypothetical protein
MMTAGTNHAATVDDTLDGALLPWALSTMRMIGPGRCPADALGRDRQPWRLSVAPMTAPDLIDRQLSPVIMLVH